MNNTNRYTKIETPELNGSDYGTNLNNQFNNINNNFARLSTSEFLRGFAGDSVECFVVSISDLINNSKNYEENTNNKYIIANKIKSYFTQLPINLIVDGEYNSKLGISDIIIIGDKQILNSDVNINQNYLNNIYILPMYFFDSTETISIENVKDYESYTGVYTYKLEYNTNVEHDIQLITTKHTISIGAYFDKRKDCICWKIGNCETGVSIQGLPGNDGKAGKLLIGTYKSIGEDGYANDIYIINYFNDSVEDLTNTSIVLTEENGYKTYIANLEKIENTNKYKAKIQPTQDITKLFDKNGLIIPFASNPQDFSKAFTITAKEDDYNHILYFSSNAKTDKNDSKTKQIVFNTNNVSANDIWTAKLDVGNENSKEYTATIYKGLNIQQSPLDGNMLMANNNGFYVKEIKNNNKVVINSELDAVKNDFNEKLKNYYNKNNDNDKTTLIKLINEHASAIKKYGNIDIINGTVIDKDTYDGLKEKDSNHLYFIYDQ